MQTEKYVHHGREVSVQPHLKGKHREHCLCYSCDKFKVDATNGADQCPIAHAVFLNCQRFSIVSPVWECPDFNHA